jgi:hypothetical protein
MKKETRAIKIALELLKGKYDGKDDFSKGMRLLQEKMKKKGNK